MAAALLAAPATAQTVPDYEAALAAVPGSPAAAVALACLPLQNFVFTAIEPSELKGPWLLSLLPVNPFGSNKDAAAWRDCSIVRETPVIAFNQASNVEIVTPPMLEDESQVRPLDPTVREPLPGYDTPSRTVPRVR